MRHARARLEKATVQVRMLTDLLRVDTSYTKVPSFDFIGCVCGGGGGWGGGGVSLGDQKAPRGSSFAKSALAASLPNPIDA
jgi:hypothetical protein